LGTGREFLYYFSWELADFKAHNIQGHSLHPQVHPFQEHVSNSNVSHLGNLPNSRQLPVKYMAHIMSPFQSTQLVRLILV
jgi:hypothetical protein